MDDVKQKKTDAERLEALKQREAALKAARARLESRIKDEERKRDTRRKILIGAAVMAHAKRQKEFALALRHALNAVVTKEADRELIKDFIE